MGHDVKFFTLNSLYLLMLAGPRDLHMFVRRNMEWVYPFNKQYILLILHTFMKLRLQGLDVQEHILGIWVTTHTPLFFSYCEMSVNQHSWMIGYDHDPDRYRNEK